MTEKELNQAAHKVIEKAFLAGKNIIIYKTNSGYSPAVIRYYEGHTVAWSPEVGIIERDDVIETLQHFKQMISEGFTVVVGE